MVVPGYHLVQRCLAVLSHPDVFLLYMGVASSISEEGCEFGVHCTCVPVQGLCVSRTSGSLGEHN